MTERLDEQQISERHRPEEVDPLENQPHSDAAAIRRKKNDALIALIDQWMADESGRQEREWPIIKKALEEDRPSYRRLFND